MNPHEPLLALRVADVEFALEPGRVFALGDNADCDLCVRGREPGIALFVRAVGGVALVRPADHDREVALRAGSQASLAGIEFAVVEDRGSAQILPIPPSLRTNPEPARAPTPAAVPAPAGETAPAAPVAPAPEPVPPPPAPAATTAPGAANSFVDLMANELRRAPWFAISLLLHALVLGIAWLLVGGPKPPPEPPARYGLSVEVDPLVDAPQAPVEIPVVVETQDPFEPLADPIPVEATPSEPEPVPDPAPGPPSALLRVGGERLAPRAPGEGTPAGENGAGGGGGNGEGAALPSGSSGDFRKTVAQLRASGLEIAFVFDSTGSMGSSITATKEGIASMLDVLHALVPHARFSLITYRDRGAGEEYVVRTLPLGNDYYAAVNFMQTIEANGGGDAPEAVLSGLLAATEQSFRAGSKRVIVLAGDAPPHPREARRTLERARQFANTPGSSVHTLMTGGTEGDAAKSFERIADAGHGHCLPIADKDRLLQTVLTLAFGREFEQDLALVQRTIAKERETPPTWARDLARRGGSELLTALDADTVSPAVVHALLRNPSRTVLNELVTALQSQTTSAAGRNAIAYVLREALSLPQAPVDPQKPKAIGGTEASELRRRIRALPD